ncbi:hypothetical protein EYF80_044964 [Liparis tanakae]|uniref:Uncharacterized protein n=1 Tax=Liparis tanakae TaxID=230148 RepID=A0A4Z2FUF0_9TELE|nr:hypothetical protein EYF80_044964 [Liparis tanakae]
MDKQVSLLQTPVKIWLPTQANQRQRRRDMAVEGTARSPEGHPTPDPPRPHTSTLPTAPDTTVS